MPRRTKPPAHLPWLSGAELRRREEPGKRNQRAEPMAMRPLARVHGPTRDDFEGLPPATAWCLVCGDGVLWDIAGKSNDRPLNRDGTTHYDTCREIPMTVKTPPAPLITVGATGPRNAQTDASGLRFYTWQGRSLPSVTTVRRMAGLPHGLHQWILGQVIDAAIARGREIVRLRDTPKADPAKMQLLRQELRSAAIAERDRAASLGTAVHDAVATGMAAGDVPDELAPRVRQYRAWLEDSGAEILRSEFQVWNLTAGYAGTVDALVRFPNGSVWLVDYKTGKGIYGEHALQLIAYRQAEFAGADDVIDRETTDLLRAVSGMAVLHLADDGWEFVVVRFDQETWDAFRGLLTFAVWMRLHERAEDVTVAAKAGAATEPEVAA